MIMITDKMEGNSETSENIKLISVIDSPITNFYNGKSVFVTGATGFLGTVLIEKLLYSCSGIDRIYILIKRQHGTTINERLVKLLDSQAFDRVRKINQDLLKKIIPIGGNLLENNIGIDEDDLIALQEKVSVVFHAAANVSLGMSLSSAVTVNTKATDKLISICKQMQNLTAFIYVSSAFSNSNKAIIDEKIYKTGLSIDTVFDILDYENNSKVIENLLDGRPNMYTFSKALAEELIQQRCNEIPTAVVRPSIILSAVKEPIPGWIKSWSGPTGIVEAAGRGLWLCWYSSPSVVFDIVPVDYVANLLIATAWDTSDRSLKGDKGVKVFNYCSGLQNPIELGTFMSISLEQNRKSCGKSSMTNRIFFISSSYITYFLLILILQTIPAILIDAVLWLLGREKRMMKIQRKLAKLSAVLEYFTHRQFLFVDRHARRLQQRMAPADQHLFQIDFTTLHWESYLRDYVLGTKIYMSNISK